MVLAPVGPRSLYFLFLKLLHSPLIFYPMPSLSGFWKSIFCSCRSLPPLRLPYLGTLPNRLHSTFSPLRETQISDHLCLIVDIFVHYVCQCVPTAEQVCGTLQDLLILHTSKRFWNTQLYLFQKCSITKLIYHVW